MLASRRPGCGTIADRLPGGDKCRPVCRATNSAIVADQYRKALENQHGKLHRHHVFLSPNGVPPEQEEERKYWQAADYTTVFELVQQLVRGEAGAVREDVRPFLTQYATTLRRNVMPDTIATKTARKIYLEHRALFDLISRSKPNYGAELKQRLRDAIECHADLKIWGETSNCLGFVPTTWVEFDAQKTSVVPRFPLLAFTFSITKDNAYLSFGMQPGRDSWFRRRVYDTAKEHGELFNDTSATFVGGWVTFHSTGLILDEADYDNWDKPETQVKIREWLARFAEHHVKDMSEVIEECLRDYQPK